MDASYLGKSTHLRLISSKANEQRGEDCEKGSEKKKKSCYWRFISRRIHTRVKHSANKQWTDYVSSITSGKCQHLKWAVLNTESGSFQHSVEASHKHRKVRLQQTQSFVGKCELTLICEINSIWLVHAVWMYTTWSNHFLHLGSRPSSARWALCRDHCQSKMIDRFPQRLFRHDNHEFQLVRHQNIITFKKMRTVW